jgi:hypothetical protein
MPSTHSTLTLMANARADGTMTKAIGLRATVRSEVAFSMMTRMQHTGSVIGMMAETVCALSRRIDEG